MKNMYSQRKVAGSMIGWLWRCRVAVGAIIVLVLTQQILTMIDPRLTQLLIDQVLVKRDVSSLNLIFIVLLALVAGRCLFKFSEDYLTSYLQNRVSFNLRLRFLQYLESRQLAYFEQKPTGEMTQLETINIPALVRFSTTLPSVLVGSTLGLILNLTALFIINSGLALIALVSIPIWIVSTFYFTGKLGPLALQVNQNNALLRSTFLQMLRGMRLIKSMASEGKEQKRYFNSLSQSCRVEARQTIWGSLTNNVIGSISVLVTAVVLWYGGHLVIDGSLSVGQLIAFNIYLGRLLPPIANLLGTYKNFNELRGLAQSVLEMTEVPAPSKELQQPAWTGKGRISLENVTFQYEEAERPAIKNLSLSIGPNSTVAFVGGSGSGKSTILDLIIGLRQPQAGQLGLDGVSLDKLERRSYLDRLGVVSQETFVFNLSLLDNVRYGRPTASRAEVEEALRKVGAAEFVAKLPQGLDTVLGASGSGLSGGQMQRLSLARAIVKQPRLLVLDEATSALDAASEKIVEQMLVATEGLCAKIIVAHRLSNVQRADCIYVLQDGELAESGTYQQLLKQKGIYFRLWSEQTRPEALTSAA